jgi:high-affinity iron transporter
MLQAFVITLREGLEAFLIVAISLAYLRKTGRRELIAAVHWGIGVSIALSLIAGLLLQRATNQALWEGALAIGAALMVASLTIHMWRTAKRCDARSKPGWKGRPGTRDAPPSLGCVVLRCS